MSKVKNNPPSDKAVSGQAKRAEETFIFGRQNYILLITSILLIIAGFIMMYGKEDIFSFTKLTLAPIVVLAGFALGIYAIMKKPAQQQP
jgi:hypothetical protein